MFKNFVWFPVSIIVFGALSFILLIFLFRPNPPQLDSSSSINTAIGIKGSASPTYFSNDAYAMDFDFSSEPDYHWLDSASSTADFIQMQRDTLGKKAKHYADVHIKIGDWFDKKMSWEEFMQRMK